MYKKMKQNSITVILEFILGNTKSIILYIIRYPRHCSSK